MYLSYPASIGEQFEFLMRRWANRDEGRDGGVDAVIGQRDGTAHDRVRHIGLLGSSGGLLGSSGRRATLKLPRDWIHAMGGEYFFAPSPPAMHEVLSV